MMEERNDKNSVVLKKIPIKSLMDVLMMIYERGCDYVNIYGNKDVLHDTITIVSTDDQEASENKNDDSEELSDDKFSDLI